eukprot:TRINITY_DN1207_c0_g1_i1.p1 TRINITY_DN1207_c0_g1~~TRINITY_DN1207_c0_g1_i1.p1  ORF type:complete len:854 (-),score=53.11 TRINITY_DN1207_c0_g1_i1:26-2587(-)
MESKEINVESELISTNPSTHRSTLDWSPKSGLTAFASGPLVYIASLARGYIFCSLRGHRQNVNALKWIETSDKNSCDLISVGGDGNLVHWRCNGDPTDHKNWVLLKEYKGIHKSSIELLSVLSIKDSVYLLSYSIDGTLVYWKSTDHSIKEFAVICTLQFGKTLLEAIGIYPLNEKANIIAIGGFTTQIHLYTHLLTTAELSYKCSLAGHQNSVRDFAFIDTTGSDLFLASGAMDGTVRIWKIRKLEKEAMKEKVVIFKDLPEEETKLHEQYKSKASYVFEGPVSDEYYNVVLESLLSYHTEGINSVEWGAAVGKGKKEVKDLRLLTGGIDGTVCCWAAGEDAEGAWNVISAFGELTSGTKYAVYGAKFCNENWGEIVAYTYNGCLFRWVWNPAASKWEPGIVPTGHFGSVNDITWDPSEQFLVSCSSDMQTKVYGQWCNTKSDTTKGQWHEITRPQIHGYEINGIVTCPSFPLSDPVLVPPFKVVSAADEKVLRIFDPPYLFLKAANEFSDAHIKYSQTIDNSSYEEKMAKEVGASASISQPLTLMNKPASLPSEGGEEGDPSRFNPETFLSNKPEPTLAAAGFLAKNEPPQEHFLSNFGLWPEVQKMYGHAYEVQCIAITHNGKFVASSAKANKAKDAYIIIWDCGTFKEVCRLLGHQLSVTQLEFSNDDSMLLSVGRDRQWILFKDYAVKGEIVQKKPEAHSRIIWSCNWAEDDQMFVTASREKKQSVKFWQKAGSEWVMESFIAELQTVSAIRFFPEMGRKRVVAGTEEGDLSIWQRETEGWKKLYQINANLCHGGLVQKMAFNKRYSKKNPGKWLLASGSADKSVRIFKISSSQIDDAQRFIYQLMRQ